MTRTLPKEPRQYDDAKLASMTEPLTIRIERIQGGQKSPVPLPSVDDDESAPGTNWSKEDIKRVEEWLVTEWAGGGLFEITVTDSSAPPIVMKWQPFWDKRTYPEKTPPPLAEATIGGSAPAPVVAQPTQGFPRMSAFPNGLPPGTPAQAPQQVAYPVYPYPPMPPAPQPGTQSWAAWQAEQERREQAAELQRLRAEGAERERQANEARHKAELERERQANEARFTAINQTISSVASAVGELRNLIAAQAQAPKANAELDAMREQLRAAEARAENERRERESRDRETALRQSIDAMNANIQRQLEETRRQSEERIRQIELAATANRGPDPLVSMFQENMRQQIEAQKELSRNQLQQMQTLQTFMMNPRDILAMASDSSKAVDQATDRVTNVFGRIIDTQQRVTENLLQMQPGGSGAIDVIRDGLGAVKDLGERWIGAKSMDARMQQQANAQMMEAQVRAVEAQERIKNGHVHTPPPPRVEQQLGAPPSVPPAPIADDGTPKRLGKTDTQWFTPAVQPELAQLRAGVAEFVDAIQKDEPPTNAKGEIVGVSPEQAVQFVLMAAQMANSRGVMIPAIVELLAQDRFADFIDVLLPDAIQEYRTDTVNALIRVARKMQGMPDLPVPESALAAKFGLEREGIADADADDDDDDDDKDGVVAPKPVPAKQEKPKTAARA